MLLQSARPEDVQNHAEAPDDGAAVLFPRDAFSISWDVLTLLPMITITLPGPSKFACMMLPMDDMGDAWISLCVRQSRRDLMPSIRGDCSGTDRLFCCQPSSEDPMWVHA